MSDEEVYQAFRKTLILLGIALPTLFVFLVVIATYNLAYWYSLMAIVGSYAVVDIMMGLFIRDIGEARWATFWGQVEVNVGEAYMLFFIGIMLTGAIAGAVILAIKYYVEQGLSLAPYSWALSALVLVLLLIDFQIVYIRSQTHRKNSQSPAEL
jgi:hypothetical protein